ncbi:hypothetical protein [Streptomyces stelliscabiei]|uniref:hypothetical protein n=1 Tax=Streptomyces stelliscabiei TaxID=146820 RepID=UPI002FEF0B71
MGSSWAGAFRSTATKRRNEFLNAAWVKAVLPVRPGHEVEAVAWLEKTVEGHAALGRPYPYDPEVDPIEYKTMTVGQVLKDVAKALQTSNTDISKTVAAEKVFETGFDPLAGGFRPAEPYQVFDQWIEVLPTDQIAAVPVSYDPKTGQQL